MSETSTSNSSLKVMLKEFLKNNFTVKLLIRRCIWFSIALLIVLPPSLGMNLWATKTHTQIIGWPYNFLNIYVTFNDGVAFSIFANAGPAVVYVLQSFISLIILSAVLFAKKWYQILLISMAFFGGFFNIMDRTTPVTFAWDPQHITHYHVVIDYFCFFNSAIFNFPDVFVLTGVIGATLLYFIMNLVGYAKEKKSKGKS